MLHKLSQEMTKPLHNSRILIIDDLILNRELIVSYLEKEGFHFIEIINDNVSILEKAVAFNPDLIILNLDAAHRAGIAVLKQLRANPLFVQIPILVHPVNGSLEERSEAWEAGAS